MLGEQSGSVQIHLTSQTAHQGSQFSTHYWGKTRRGGWVVKRKTQGKRLNQAKSEIWAWCKHHRHLPMTEQYQALSTKLRGHYQYFGIRCNYEALKSYYRYTERAWRHWLSRRQSQAKLSWKKFTAKYGALFSLPQPRIVHGA